MVSGGDWDVFGSRDAERERVGDGGRGCGSSGVLERDFAFCFFCFGCFAGLVFFGFVAFFSTGASSLCADVMLALRFSLFFRCGVWKCIVESAC